MAKDNSQGFKWRNTVAGCTAGFIPVLALHPLDVVKTRLQVQDGVRGALPLYRGVADAVGSIVRQEGWRSLYAGLTPALIGAGASWGVFFSAYNRARARYQRRTGSAQLSPAVNLAAAAEAGALVSFVTNPIWVVKTRLELQRGVRSASAAAATAVRQALPPYRGMVDAVKQIAREEGLAGFYRGLGPSLLLVSHGAIQLMVYEELKSLAVHRGGTAAEQRAQRAHVAAWRRRQQEGGSSGSSGSGDAAGEAEGPWGFRRRDAEEAAARGGPPLRKPSNAEVLGMGALSKLAASVLTYPPQVVRSRLQQRMARRAIRYRSGLDVLRITLRREGVGGLYKGLLPNVLRVMPQSALTFLVYETVMKLLEEQPRQPASGDRHLGQ